MREEILKAWETLQKTGEKRGFTQSVDVVVSLKGLDLKKPGNKFSDDFALPYEKGKDATVVVFSDNLSDVGCDVMNSESIQQISAVKRDAKKLANRTDFFLAEAPLMPMIGKMLGQVLAPRNKMPKIISGDPKRLVENYKKSVRLAVKSSPVIQCTVGREDLQNEKIVGNIESILKFLETKLPRGRQNMGKVLLKFTMSKPVKIEVK